MRPIHQKLHKLWTVAVHQEGYDKMEWKELEQMIMELEKELGGWKDMAWRGE